MTITYSQKVLDHFKKPHNQGVIKDADSVGQAGNPVCGDVLKIYLKIADKKGQKVIKNAKFEALGCAASIAVSSALTDMVKGMSLDEAMAINKNDIVADLGGLPPTKIHCSMLGLEALQVAVKEYKK